jgi:hypothetical protein
MAINSRMWGVGWRQPEALPSPKRARIDKRAARGVREISASGLPSIPGRTARLKAIYLLQIAAESEHALMAQYLYAAYSLDESFGQSRGGEAARIIDRWKRDIRLVARQEMAHFVTVQNLLISLGADVYVNRENNFSEHPDAYPFPVAFERVSLDSLARYVATERPAPEEILDSKTQRRLNEILKLTDSTLKTKVNRVGVLYASLYWLLLSDDRSQGPWQMPVSTRECMRLAGLGGVHVDDSDFVPPGEYEEFAANRREWEVFEDSLHVDEADPRARALKAIHWIMLQGEGQSGSGCGSSNDSHFCRFLDIYSDLAANPGLAAAARRVPLNPVVNGSHRKEPVRSEAEFITHPESKLWAQLFNVRYQMLLLDVLLALSTSRDEDPDLRTTLTTWAGRHEMEHLKQIGQLLPTLPRHLGSKRLRAGAPFETAEFPADSTKRWDQQRVLMKGSAQLVRALEKKVSPRDQRFSLLRTIASFDNDRKDLVDERSTASRDYEWREGGNQRIRS